MLIHKVNSVFMLADAGFGFRQVRCPGLGDHGVVTTTQTPPRTSGGRRRGVETLRDIVLSMAVVGLVVAAIYGVVAWQRPEVQGPIRPAVDVESVVGQVQSTGPFAVWEPRLTGDWQPTSAWFDSASVSGVDGGVLHLGFLTPNGSYAEVRQTDAATDAVVDEWIDGAVAVGELEIDGRIWQQVESEETGQRGLVLVRPDERPEVTVVVTGKADEAELTELAASLG